MKKKFLPLLIAAAVVFGTASCSGGGAQTAPAAGQTADNGGEIAANSGDAANEVPSGSEGAADNTGLSWDSIDKSKVVASVDGMPEMDITFGDFFGEYMYYLLAYRIDDDMSSENAAACQSYRENIMNYLQFEKIFLRIAEEEGVGVSTLTQDELKEIQASTDSTYENFLLRYYDEALEKLGAEASEADIKAYEEERLKQDMELTELPDDIFFIWERNDFVQNKLLGKVTGDASVTEEQVDQMFDEYVQTAKELIESDPISYESNSTYTWVYVPGGTRLADQILFMFDEETRSAITAARNDGNDDEADRIREEAYGAQLKEKTEDLLALIEAGSDFDELQEIYNEDGANDPYPVIIGSKLYVPEFTDAVFSIDSVGGVSYPAISDYGVHIIKYIGDAEVTDENIAEIRSSMKSYLEYQEGLRLQEEAYEDWMSRYPYTVDRETLKISEPQG